MTIPPSLPATDTLEVTQADREAAARFVIDCNAGGLAAKHHEAYLRGEGDGSVLIRILARHRIEATKATLESEVSRLSMLGERGEEQGVGRCGADAPPGPREPSLQAVSAASAASVPNAWQPMETAPLNTPVRVRLGLGMTIVARLVPDAGMTEAEQVCDQWQAEYEGEHPDCWTDGCCWTSNEDDIASAPPTAWMPLLAQRVEARSDETPQEVRPEGREPDGEADAPEPGCDVITHWQHVFEDRRYSNELVGNMVRANADMFLRALRDAPEPQSITTNQSTRIDRASVLRRVRFALEASAETFREYERHHVAKLDEGHERLVRAERNAMMAEQCESAIRALKDNPDTMEGK